MHALHLSVAPPPAGLSASCVLDTRTTLTRVAAAVRQTGAQVTVLQAGHSDERLERERVRYRFVTTSWQRLRRRNAYLRLAQEVGQIRPDIIHVHGLCFPSLLRTLRRIAPRTPILVQDHGNGVPRRWLRGVWRSAYAGVDGVMFTHPRQAEPFVRAGIFTPSLRVWGVPESSSTFTSGDRELALEQTGLSGDPIVLWIGRMIPSKDPFTVLSAVEHACRDLPELRLWCYYPRGVLSRAVEKRVEASTALTTHVRLQGYVHHDHVEQLCRSADFILSASQREGSGYSIIEALACGVTPVVARIPPFEALTSDGAVGALVPPADPLEMAQALVDLSSRDRTELRKTAVRHFANHLSFEKIGRSLREFYETMLRE